MRLLITILFSIFSFKSFSQEKENNGTIYKNGPYVEAVRNLMNIYKTNNIKKIKKAYEKISVDKLVFRDALNNMDEKSPLGKSMDLDQEMENMSEIFNTHEIISIKELGYPDHFDYKEANDLVISWWQFTWRNKLSGNQGPIHLMIGHFFDDKNKMIGETYYFNPNTLPK